MGTKRFLMRASVEYTENGSTRVVSVHVVAKDGQDLSRQIEKKGPEFGKVIFFMVIRPLSQYEQEAAE